MMEALVCHPLDTIKVRMQLSKRSQRGVSFSPFKLLNLPPIHHESFSNKSYRAPAAASSKPASKS